MNINSACCVEVLLGSHGSRMKADEFDAALWTGTRPLSFGLCRQSHLPAHLFHGGRTENLHTKSLWIKGLHDFTTFISYDYDDDLWFLDFFPSMFWMEEVLVWFIIGFITYTIWVAVQTVVQLQLQSDSKPDPNKSTIITIHHTVLTVAVKLVVLDCMNLRWTHTLWKRDPCVFVCTEYKVTQGDEDTRFRTLGNTTLANTNSMMIYSNIKSMLGCDCVSVFPGHAQQSFI